MNFDPTITLGSVISALLFLLTVVIGWVAFKARVDTVLENQAQLMTHLTTRFERHEQRDEELFDEMRQRLMDLTGGIQRLVGQSDVFRKRLRDQ